nr:hypothetical protein 14 [bacterium]
MPLSANEQRLLSFTPKEIDLIAAAASMVAQRFAPSGRRTQHPEIERLREAATALSSFAFREQCGMGMGLKKEAK